MKRQIKTYLYNSKNRNPKNKLLFLFFLIVLLFIISSIIKKPKISLVGPASVDIVVGTDFHDEGAFAKYGQKNISDKIQTSISDIDTSKPGTYNIEYSINYKNKTASLTKTINVIDNEAPTLALNGDSEINISLGSKYNELGCYATDNCDGDLTTKISIENTVNTSQLGSYLVTYKVEDSSKNQASINRTVNVVSKDSKNISTQKVAGVPVLMYHFFYDKDSGETGKDANCMEIHDFEDQLKYLVENNYYFPTWDEVTNYVNGKSCLPDHSIVITVDDGNPTFFELAVPVIEKYDVKATSFVVTSWIENSDYLKQFDTNKIFFESHSHDMHRAGTNGKGRFLTLSQDEAYTDVTTSQSFIGNSTVFCYPFGHYSDSCEAVLKNANFNLAFTTKYGRIYPGDNCYELPRIRMSKGESLNAFIKKVS